MCNKLIVFNHGYSVCQECQDYVHEYCSIHRALLVVPNSKKEEQSESPQLLFSVKVELENCNSDDAIQNDRVYINPITSSSKASGKYPDEKLINLLATLEECSPSYLMDTYQRKETQTHPSLSLNVTEDIIDDAMLLAGNSDFEPSEIALNSENLAEKDSDIKRIQAQLDEEIMRDLEAEAKIFEAIQVSKGYRLMIAKESFQGKSEENRPIVNVKNEDMCESDLIIVDNGMEDIDTTNDSVCEGTENNFHSEIVNEKNAMDSVDDGIEDIAQCYQMSNRLAKETLENRCKKQSMEAVTNNHTNEETKGTCIKSERKLQTTNLSLPKLQYNDVDAGETDLKSQPNLKKNTFLIKKEKFHEPVFKNMNSEKISKEKNTHVVPNKQENKTPNYCKYTQKANINVINKITAKFECNECGKQFSTKDIQTDHIIKCIKPKTLVNDSQLKKADTSNSLLPETNQCKTNRKHSIEAHLEMHTNTMVLSCSLCEYNCIDKSILKKHKQTHRVEKSFRCDICEYTCSRKSSLIRHKRTHTGEKPFSCNICGFKCARKNSLIRHKRTHTGEKPFGCNICEYRCSLKSGLKDHIRIHTGEKPFCCNICEYRSAQKSSLKDHIKTHTGDKPFSCNICDYRFSRRRNLKYHIRTHTGEKPYSCNICSYKCAHRSTLNAHLRTHN